jgi:hypothetical protein
MDGTVTIPITLFDQLRTASEVAEEKKLNLHRAAKEIEVFLSFLCTREHIQEYIDEFNRQSSTSRINIEEGKVKIVIRNE